MRFPSVRAFPILLLLLAAMLLAPATPAGRAAPATPVPAACDPGAGATPVAATFPLTITDDLERKVTIARESERIVSIVPSNTEILFALGLGDRVVAVDGWSDYPPAALDKPKVGDYIDPDLERIVAAEPDLVLAAGAHDAGVLPHLEELGITTVVVEPENVAEVLAGIDLIGRATGATEPAARLACDLGARIAAVETAVAGADRPRVFFELGPDLFSAGPGSYIDDLISRAGGSNIAHDAGSDWPQLSAEAVVAADPQVILLADYVAGVTPESVAARPGWAGIAAVEAGRVVALNADLIARPGPRMVDGLEEMARAIHPDRFPGQGS